MEFECFFQLTHFSSFKFKLIPILEPKFSLEINSCDIKVIITLKFESFSWSIQWNSTWFKPIPVLGPTGNPIFWFYVIENLGTISYKPLQLLLQKWHFSDKNSAITRRGIKISKNGLHPRIRRAILHRHTNFQPNLSHSGNHLFPVDTLSTAISLFVTAYLNLRTESVPKRFLKYLSQRLLTCTLFPREISLLTRIRNFISSAET